MAKANPSGVSKNFCESLSVAISKTGKGKADFARTAGVSAAYLSHLLSGYRNGTPDILAKLLVAIDDSEDRHQLIRAFFQDVLEEIRSAVSPKKEAVISQIDGMLDLGVKDMISTKANIGNLPREFTAVLEKVVARAEKDKIYTALVAEMMSATLSLPAVAAVPPPKRVQPAPLTDD